jgi:hypothetical protein
MTIDASGIEPGDELYVSDVWSIDNGWSDQCGGIAIVESIRQDSCGNVFVTFLDLKHHSPNLKYILENQKEWELEYGSKLAHDCPEGTICPNPRRKSAGCLKKSEARKFYNAVKGSALRSKLMRQARREIQ